MCATTPGEGSHPESVPRDLYPFPSPPEEGPGCPRLRAAAEGQGEGILDLVAEIELVGARARGP